MMMMMLFVQIFPDRTLAVPAKYVNASSSPCVTTRRLRQRDQMGI